MFLERAPGAMETVPALRQIRDDRAGPRSPGGCGYQLGAKAARYKPPTAVAALAPDNIGGLTFTGGTTARSAE